MGDTIRDPRLIDCGYTIATADDAGGLRGRNRQRYGAGTLGKGYDLKYSHRPVPHHCFGLTDRSGEGLSRLRPDVNTHPSRRDAILWHHSRGSAPIEAFSDHMILRELDVHPQLCCPGE